MTAPVIVQHDGFAMPLDTFIDAHRMVRVDRFAVPSLASDARLMTVDARGQVTQDCRANQVDLHAILAFRAIDGQQEQEPCFLCGTTLDVDALCDDCSDDADYAW